MSVLAKAALFFSFIFGFTLFVSISVAEISLGIVLLLFLILLLFRKQDFNYKFGLLDLAFVSYVVVGIVAALLSPQIKFGLREVLRSYHVIAFYIFVLLLAGKGLQAAWKGYLSGVVIWSLFALGLYLYWNIVDPVSNPDWMGLFGYRVYAKLLLNRYRAFGVIHPMTFAELLIPGLLFFLASTLRATENRKRIPFAAATCLIFCTLLANKQRGPWMGALAGVLVLLYFYPKRISAMLLAAGVVVVLFFPKDIFERINTFRAGPADHSFAMRVQMWRSGWYVTKRNLLTGIGPGQLGSGFEKYKSNADFPASPPTMGDDMHNLYLNEWAEKGTLGLLAILFLFGSFIYLSLNLLHKTREENLSPVMAQTLLASFVSTVVLNVTERALNDAEVAFLTWLLVAFLVRLTHQPSEA